MRAAAMLVVLLACASSPPKHRDRTDDSAPSGTSFEDGGTATEPWTCRSAPPAPAWRRFEVDRITGYAPIPLQRCDNPMAGRPACQHYGPSVGDLDGDGVVEVLWNGYADGARIWPIDEIHPGTAGEPATLAPDPDHPSFEAMLDGAANGARYQPVAEAKVALAGIADLDGDGDLDVLHTTFWDDGLLIGLRNEGSGNFTPIVAPAPVLGELPGMVEVADQVDWDNDGRLDLATLVRWPAAPGFEAEGWSVDLYLTTDAGWVSVPWVVHSLDVPINQAAQVGMVLAGGERTWVMAGNTQGDQMFDHPILYPLDDGLDPEGIPVAVPALAGGPSSGDGTMMGMALIDFVFDEGDGPTRAPVLLSTVDGNMIQAHRRLTRDIWVDMTLTTKLEPTPNSWVNPYSVNQLPWYIWPLDDHGFAVANGDDWDSWPSANGDPVRDDWYFNQDQLVDVFQADGAGGFARTTELVEVDGVVGGQPTGSYEGFYERDGIAVWLGSWLDEGNPHGRVMRSWLAERVAPEGHHWVTVAPRGTTSNPLGIGTEVFFTADPDCADELTGLLSDRRPPEEVARACGACGYGRQVVGEPDAGHVMVGPEVRLYLGADEEETAPSGTVLLRWPSGTIQRIDAVDGGRLEPVEPETVTVAQDAYGATIRVMPVDASGQSVPYATFGPAQVIAVGVPVDLQATLGADGAGEIAITAPSAADLDAWTASQAWSTGSTQLKIEGTDQRPRLFWP